MANSGQPIPESALWLKENFIVSLRVQWEQIFWNSDHWNQRNVYNYLLQVGTDLKFDP